MNEAEFNELAESERKRFYKLSEMRTNGRYAAAGRRNFPRGSYPPARYSVRWFKTGKRLSLTSLFVAFCVDQQDRATEEIFSGASVQCCVRSLNAT